MAPKDKTRTNVKAHANVNSFICKMELIAASKSIYCLLYVQLFPNQLFLTSPFYALLFFVYILKFQ